MDVLLVDRLACPRCGPEFGLVVLADRIENRRLIDGSLGCPNCRDAFPVVGGCADLRSPPRGDVPTAGEAPTEVEAVDVAALLGLEGEGGYLVVGEGCSTDTRALSERFGVGVVALGVCGEDVDADASASRMIVRGRLPLRDRSVRGVVARAREGSLPELARVLIPGGRLLLLGGGVEPAALEAEGLRPLAREDARSLAEREGPRMSRSRRLPVV